jgi:hypothetical protein
MGTTKWTLGARTMIIRLPAGARLELQAGRDVDIRIVGEDGTTRYSESMQPDAVRYLAEWLLTAAARSERRRRADRGPP